MEKCTTKKVCAAARSFWPEARFWDFFGLKKAEGLLKAKKIPKTGRRPKWPCQSTKLFLSFQMMRNVVHWPMNYIFLPLASFFPFKNVLFLKRSEYKTKRPVTKIYLERQKSEEGVGSPAEQGDAESWVVFRPETRAACRGTKNHPARGISLRSRAAHYPSHFFVSKNKFESPIVAFFCNQISSK